jgi:hypothetical protein
MQSEDRLAQLRERLRQEILAARKRSDQWLLVHLSLKGDRTISIGADSVFEGFKDSRELRGPRWRTLENAREFSDLGYSWLVAGELSAYLLFRRLLSQDVPPGVIMHVDAVHRWAPACAAIVPTLNSVRGFLNPELPENKGRAARRPGRVARDRLTSVACRLCGSASNLTLHHLIPREAGGATEDENLLSVCRPCHDAIHNGDVDVRDLVMEVSIKRTQWILKSVQD